MSCERCHDEFTVVRGDGDDEHPLCDPCAQELVVELREALKAERDATTVMWGCDVKALKDAGEELSKCWSDFASQEMYGEMLREGMSNESDACGPSDFDRWEEAHDKLRAALDGAS